MKRIKCNTVGELVELLLQQDQDTPLYTSSIDPMMGMSDGQNQLQNITLFEEVIEDELDEDIDKKIVCLELHNTTSHG